MTTPSPNMERANTYIVIDAKDNYLLVQHGLNRYYVSIKNHPYQIGDFLHINGQLAPIKFYHVEGQFDFQTYLVGRGVTNELRVFVIEDKFMLPLRFRWRQIQFLARFDADSATYLGAILFNRRDYQTATIMQFEQANLVHLLSASGMVIYGHLRIIETILIRFMNEKKARKYAFLTLVPWLMFNPSAIAIWRVILSGVINLVYKPKPSQVNVYWIKKGHVGIIMLLFSRYIVNSPGFYLSFGLATCLYLLRLHKSRTGAFKRIFIRFVPWLFLLPYLVITSGTINLIGVLLFVPLVTIHGWLLTLGLLQLYIWPLPMVSLPLVRASESIIKLSQFVQIELHFRMWSVLAVTFYLSLLFLCFYIGRLKFTHRFNVGVYACATFIVLAMLPIQNLYEASISFINVGQGDAILIKNRKTAILVDTGGSLSVDIASTSLIPYFKRHGVSELAAVIISHDDYDHSGALTSLTANFPIHQLIKEPSRFPMTLGGLTFHNLNHRHELDDANLSSLVLSFNLAGHEWLLMGDAPLEVEQDIIGRYPHLDCDYIKIGHHGSLTSTSDAFISHTTPKEAIISVGRNNYGHPHHDVINRLLAHDVTVRRTDIEGTIKYNYWAR
ncbi:MAG TPA: ComEC/Rec2 family competence protein [Bacilli bacterium]|nr:ComEC/Rec2 family competence protein [Bacilli bacterium]